MLEPVQDEAIVDGEDDIATQQHGDSGDPSPDVSSGAGASENSGDDYDPVRGFLSHIYVCICFCGSVTLPQGSVHLC